jgi:hypothetical protein
MIDLEDSTRISHNGDVADDEIWSPRPIFIIVVIVVTFIATMAGIALGIATIKSENGPAKLQKEATTRVDVPVQDAAIVDKPPVSPPMSSLDMPQAEDKAPPFGSLAGPQAAADTVPPAVAAPAQAQTPAEPLSTPAPIEPEKMKTDLVRSDDAPVPNVTLPQANVMRVPLPPPRPAAIATAPTPKMAARVAKTLKPAASTQSDGHGQPRQIAKAKAKPASRLNTEATTKSHATVPDFKSPKVSP